MNLNIDLEDDGMFLQNEILPLLCGDPEVPYRPTDRGFELKSGALPERDDWINGVYPQADEGPPFELERGCCPDCGDVLVSNIYYHPTKGYLLRYDCWDALKSGGKRCVFYAVP